MALEDASTLTRKEWSRGEPGEDIPHMYSTIDGKLTPTAPVYEDMRMETPLHVTPEESLESLSAAIGGVEDSTATQQSTNNTKDQYLMLYLQILQRHVLRWYKRDLIKKSYLEGMK